MSRKTKSCFTRTILPEPAFRNCPAQLHAVAWAGRVVFVEREKAVHGIATMAIWNRRADPGVIHHSAQYTSLAYGQRLCEAGLVSSMGSVGDAYDNAVAEAFFATLECELIDRHIWVKREEARRAIFDYIEGFYNPRRRHSALGYLSPAEYERRWRDAPAA